MKVEIIIKADIYGDDSMDNEDLEQYIYEHIDIEVGNLDVVVLNMLVDTERKEK
jgi:hypothetical protein